jgi:hypothetical protein
MASSWSGVCVSVALVALAGCAPVDDPLLDDPKITSEIVRGTEATSTPFACVISMNNGGLCSGALVAPNVVLTAGHCVAGSTRWSVRCPYASDTSTVTASVGEYAPTYPNRDDPSREWIDNNLGADLGLLRLDRALNETRVARPRIALVTPGTQVVAIGRVSTGRLTWGMYRSPAFAVNAYDRTRGYWSGVDRSVIESGDSGGPLLDARTGELVGVNSSGVEAAYCRAGSVCDVWATLIGASSWYTTTVQRFSAGVSPAPSPSPAPAPAPAPQPAPSDVCATSTNCASCTARSTCGWCNGRCFTGTSRGPTAGTCGTSAWAWLSSQCR